MPKPLKASLRLTSCSLLVSLACSIQTAAGTGQRPIAYRAGQANVSQSIAVAEALQTSFGSTVEAVKGFKPYYLTGDFSGDGAQDILVVVRITRPRSRLPKDVRIANPFKYGTGATTFPADLEGKPTLALAIIHGSKAGWKTAQPTGKFLLLGESSILILQYERATSLRPGDAKDLMSLVRKGRKGSPRGAKGDSVNLGTEATDSLLYWNGESYRWKEGSDD